MYYQLYKFHLVCYFNAEVFLKSEPHNSELKPLLRRKHEAKESWASTIKASGKKAKLCHFQNWFCQRKKTIYGSEQCV